MTHAATLEFSEEIIREAVFGFWRRSVGVALPIAMAVVAAMLVLLLARRNSSWVVGVLATVLIVSLVFVAVLYAVHYRNAITKFRGMPSRQASFVASSEGFVVTSEIGTSTLPWSSVVELWRFQNCWLLLFSKAQFITLPLRCIPLEMQNFIASRIVPSAAKNAA